MEVVYGKCKIIYMNRDWFRDKLKEAHLSQRSLADKMGVRYPAFSEVLSGKRRLSLDEAAKMAREFHCSVDDVYSASKGGYPETRAEIDAERLFSIYADLKRMHEKIPPEWRSTEEKLLRLAADIYAEEKAGRKLDDGEKSGRIYQLKQPVQ